MDIDLHKRYGFFSFKRESCMTFFVFQAIRNNSKVILFFGERLQFLVQLFRISFMLQNGTPIKTIGFDSKPVNKKLGTIGSSSSLSKSFIKIPKNVIGYPSVKNLFLIWFFSWYKFELDHYWQYSSLFIAYLLYLFWHLTFPMYNEFICFAINFGFSDIILQ